jgi:hypothetical protein
MSNLSQVCAAGTELSVAITTSAVLIGILPVSPVVLIFDNQGTASVAIYVNGTSSANLWRTFPAGEALILDMRANHGIASNFTFPQGTTFYGAGTTGNGNFSISYVYAP